MKMKKLLLAAVLAASAAACSADVTAPELRTPAEAGLGSEAATDTTTQTTTQTPTTGGSETPKEDSGWLGSGGG